MPSNDNWTPPQIVGFGAAIALVCVGVGVAAYLICHAVADAMAVVENGAAVIASSGPWVAPATSAGIAATGGAAFILVVNRIYFSVKRKTYEWALPTLTLIAMFFADLCGEFVFEKSVFLKTAFAATVGLALLAGGYLLTRKNWAFKTGGAVLAIAAPIYVLGEYLLTEGSKSLRTAIDTISNSAWIGLGALSAVCLVAILVGAFGKASET